MARTAAANSKISYGGLNLPEVHEKALKKALKDKGGISLAVVKRIAIKDWLIKEGFLNEKS
jgi:hypothetical protein